MSKGTRTWVRVLEDNTRTHICTGTAAWADECREANETPEEHTQTTVLLNRTATPNGMAFIGTCVRCKSVFTSVSVVEEQPDAQDTLGLAGAGRTA